jgi:hypothetical protein
LNPLNDAWKYRIRKFQNKVFFMPEKDAWTFELFREINTARPTSASKKKIAIAERATPSSA